MDIGQSKFDKQNNSTGVRCDVTKCANHAGGCHCSLDNICICCDETGCTNCGDFKNR